MSSEPLYLVDGSGYIYRAFYAVPPLSNSKGLPTNALTGFSRMLTKLLRDVSAKYIAVAFDLGDKTFRHERYEDYKANRSECPEDLVLQMPYFRSLVSAFGIRVLEKSGVEADDIIGTIATCCTDTPVVIVSGDKDLCQLVDERVTVWDAMRDIRYDPAGVEAKFGVKPGQIIDFLALTGDSSDNVPGVQGVGPKTAVQLLSTFGSVDALLANLPAIEEIKGLRGAKRIRELLSGGSEILALSKELVTLKKDVTPYVDEPSFEAYRYTGPNTEELAAISAELEIRNLFGLENRDTPAPFVLTSPDDKPPAEKKVAKKAVEPQQTQPDLFAHKLLNKKFHLVTEESIGAMYDVLSRADSFAFDTETDSIDRLNAKILGASFSVCEEEAYFIPFALQYAQNLSFEDHRERLQKLFADHSKRKLASNLKFDLAMLRTHGIEIVPPFGDTMLASYVLNPDYRQHGLKDLARRFLGEEMTTYEQLVKDRESLAEVPAEEIVQYAAHDAEAAFRVHAAVSAKFTPGQRWVYENIEVPLVPVLEDMERFGIRLDLGVLQSLSAEFDGEIKILEKDLIALAGREINLNSPKQLGQLLFEELKLPTAGIKKTTHGFSTDASALERLSKAHPLPAKLLEYRELFKLKSTYVDALKDLIRPETGRVHTCFNQAIAATGRLSSSDPNLQNIPIRNERGRRLRTAFVADDGWSLISADYSQIELRILAHLSSDAELSAAFLSQGDIHTKTAQLIFSAEYGSADDGRRKELRRYAKTINFGIIYGMGAQRLAQELGISRNEASEFIEKYFHTYSGVRSYFEQLEEITPSLGYVETLYGRRRYLRDIDTSGRDPRFAMRAALNAPIQGTAADIMKLAMLRLHEVMKPMSDRARLVLQVHDELIVEARTEHAEEIRKIVVEQMSGAAALQVPLVVDSRISSAWG